MWSLAGTSDIQQWCRKRSSPTGAYSNVLVERAIISLFAVLRYSLLGCKSNWNQTVLENATIFC